MKTETLDSFNENCHTCLDKEQANHYLNNSNLNQYNSDVVVFFLNIPFKITNTINIIVIIAVPNSNYHSDNFV